MDLFLQQVLSLLLIVQLQTLVHNSLAFLQPQRRAVHPLLQGQDTISLQALGIGSKVIRCGTNFSSSALSHPIPSGFGRLGYWQHACFHTND